MVIYNKIDEGLKSPISTSPNPLADKFASRSDANVRSNAQIKYAKPKLIKY